MDATDNPFGLNWSFTLAVKYVSNSILNLDLFYRLLSQVWETRKSLDTLRKNLNNIDSSLHTTQ